MNLISSFARLLSDAVALAEECHGHTAESLIAAGVPDTTAAQLTRLADVYFDETTFTRYQRKCLEAARANRHSLPTLIAIEKYAGRVKSQRDKWRLREFATQCTGSTKEVMAASRKKLREIKGSPKPPEPGTKITRRDGDVWTMTVHASSDEIAEMAQHVDSPADLLDLVRKREKAVADAVTREDLATESNDSFTQHVTCESCGAETEAKQVVAGLRTNVIVRLDELPQVIFGNGDDCRLKMTNGATITGKDLVTRMLADAGLVTLVHPYRGPINLYRTQRLASDKQRLMAMAENPTCAWDGCNHPADTAEIHHLRSWKRGGNTNPENLAVVCPYHNGVNDDNPTKPRRGRLERIDGTIRRVPPWAMPFIPAAA